MARWQLVALCLALFVFQALAEDPIHVRAKRQQCRCVRNQNGGMTCSCAKPQLASGETLLTAEQQQQNELAHQLQNIETGGASAQARCACLQIVFHGNPQYQCHCGDQNGNPLPSTTTMVTAPPTTTTTLPPTTTTPYPTTTPYIPAEPVPTSVTGAPGQGQCQCIMIRISGPSSAHYQCNCQNTPNEIPTTAPPAVVTSTLPPVTLPPTTVAPTTTTPPVAVFPPVGTVNSTEQGCFCVDQTTHNIEPSCGCQCNCFTMLCTVPTGVCACPQDAYGQPQAPQLAETAAPIYETVTTVAPITLPPTTIAPVTYPPSTLAPIEEHYPVEPAQGEQYPLTTTCVMYVGVQASPCVCLPQYDQCAQNICCLKAKFRSHKKTQQGAEPSTIDMLMNVLQKIKTKFDN